MGSNCGFDQGASIILINQRGPIMLTVIRPGSLFQTLVVAGACAFLLSLGTAVLAGEKTPMKSEMGEMKARGEGGRNLRPRI